MNTHADGKLHEGDTLITCAAIVGHDDSKLSWAMSSAVWCGRPATLATVCDPSKNPSWCNVGHWYCAEHAPKGAKPIVWDVPA